MIDGSCAKPIIIFQTIKKEKDNILTFKIIKQGVNDDYYTNIIREKNLQYSYKTLY